MYDGERESRDGAGMIVWREKSTCIYMAEWILHEQRSTLLCAYLAKSMSLINLENKSVNEKQIDLS